MYGSAQTLRYSASGMSVSSPAKTGCMNNVDNRIAEIIFISIFSPLDLERIIIFNVFYGRRFI